MDESRLSRDDEELPGLVYTLRDAGVSIWRYTDRAQVFTKTALDRGMLAMRATFAAAEREAAQQRTREALRAKAKAKHVAGGKVYGYRNVRNGSNTARVVDDTEAAVVRRIFKLTAEGHGLLKIAKRLNAEGIPSPRGDGWATTAIHAMLRNDLYRGIDIYGRTTWQRRKGKKRKVAAPESEWIIRAAPELRIVPDALWTAAHGRITRTRATHTGGRVAGANGTNGHRPEAGLSSNHLLSGFLRCGTCSGNMFVMPRSGKRGEPQLYYVCTTHHKRGNTRCTNRYGVPYHDLTDDVLKQLKAKMLNPAIIEAVVTTRLAQQSSEPDQQAAECAALRSRLTKLDWEITRYTRAIGLADTGLPSVVAALQARQREQADVQATLEHLEGLERTAERFDVERFRKFLTTVVANLELMLYHPDVASQDARQLIRSLLVGPLRVTATQRPDGSVFFEYEAPTAFDAILAGVLEAAGGPAAGRAAGPARNVTKPNTTKLVPPG